MNKRDFKDAIADLKANENEIEYDQFEARHGGELISDMYNQGFITFMGEGDNERVILINE